MAGIIKQLLDKIIETRSQGNPATVQLTKVKLILKGVDPDKFTASSEDDPKIISKIQDIAKELAVTL